MRREAFSMVELIFVIVIIGILSIVAIPKFMRMSDSAKISADLATASSIQTVIDTANGEWLVNEGNFTWGINRPRSELNAQGFPKNLGTNGKLDFVIRGNKGTFNRISGTDTSLIQQFQSRATKEVKIEVAGKPDIGDYWEYNSTAGTFNLIDSPNGK